MGMGMHSFFQLGMKNGNAFLFSSRNGNGNAFLKLRNGPMSDFNPFFHIFDGTFGKSAKDKKSQDENLVENHVWTKELFSRSVPSMF